jgi:hypothetical protein
VETETVRIKVDAGFEFGFFFNASCVRKMDDKTQNASAARGCLPPKATLSVSPRCTDLLVYGINGDEGATMEVI